ncbi:hypothetical protein EMIT0111MI5_10855 [Burkholderia sp. IT-111MI5]
MAGQEDTQPTLYAGARDGRLSGRNAPALGCPLSDSSRRRLAALPPCRPVSRTIPIETATGRSHARARHGPHQPTRHSPDQTHPLKYEAPTQHNTA